MTSRNNAGSGGVVERAIFFMAGCIMGTLGAVLAWLSYKWAISPAIMEYRWLWITIGGGLAFFMLRGAWFTVMPQKEEKYLELETSRRSRDF